MITDKRIFWVLFISASFYLIYLLSPILMPFVAAALLAYLGDPLVDKLETYKLSRTLAVTTVFLVIVTVLLLIILLLIPILETQIKRLAGVLPSYIDWALTISSPFLQERFGIDPQVFEGDKLKTAFSSHWKETGGLVRGLAQTISKSGALVMAWAANLALIPLLTFYLLRDWDHLVAYVRDLLPRNVEPTVAHLTRESDQMLGAFLRGQLLVMLCLGTIYFIGLAVLGIEFALLIGMIAGVVSFVPYLGLIVGISIAGLAAIFQFQDPIYLLWVGLVFGIAQMIEGMILTPLLVGDRIGLHPVTVIFAVLAGGQLFGFAGILLALPVAAVLAVIMRHLHHTYKKSHIYGLDIETK